MSEERQERVEDLEPGTAPWSEQLRAQLVAAAQREVDGSRPARRRLLCRHRGE